VYLSGEHSSFINMVTVGRSAAVYAFYAWSQALRPDNPMPCRMMMAQAWHLSLLHTVAVTATGLTGCESASQHCSHALPLSLMVSVPRTARLCQAPRLNPYSGFQNCCADMNLNDPPRLKRKQGHRGTGILTDLYQGPGGLPAYYKNTTGPVGPT
jgi:hypothetical protein